jgi:uncharacterized protein (DUF2342 family)
MGIDGIGSKGPPAPPPTGGPQGPARTPEAGRAFEVDRKAAPVAAAPAEAPRGALERLRAGEIDVDGYVDAKVHEATAHLGVLPPARLDEIRAALRDRMRSDPALAELLRTAVGHAPSPPSDD